MTNPWRAWTPGQPLAKKGSGGLFGSVFPELDRCESLVRACHKGDIGQVRELLEGGVSPDILLWSRDTSLLAASVGRKRYEVAQALLAAGADPMFPVSRHAEFVLEQFNADLAHRVSEATTALDRAKDDRNWKWAGKLLDHAFPLRASLDLDPEDDLAREKWRSLGVGLMVRRAPPSILVGYLKKMEEMGLSPRYKEMFSSLADRVRPSKKAFETVFGHYLEKKAKGDHLFRAIDAALVEANALEFPSSGLPSSSSPPQGWGLGWMIAGWVEMEESGKPLVEWAKRAAAQGQGRLLEKTLLPLISDAGLEDGLAYDLVRTTLKSGRHPGPVFDVLDRHWGAKRINETLGCLDAGVGDAWRSWLSGASVSTAAGGNPLVSARRLESAGLRVPQRSDRSFLEDFFSIGVAVVSACAGEEGRQLVDLLVRCGADPLQPNLQNRNPADILEDTHEKWGKLAHIKAHLDSLQMDGRLPSAGAVPSSPLVRPARF